MQRPGNPKIIFSRSIADWISRVNQKHKRLAELKLSEAQRNKIDLWVESAFVDSAFRLEGAEGNPSSEPAAPELIKNAPHNRLVLGGALRKVVSDSRASGNLTALTPDLLREMHDSISPSAGFRTGERESGFGTSIRAESLPMMVEGACQWYAAESFVELNPIEQSSIVLLRLLELQPFEESNVQVALLAASIFTLRSELPPIIIKPEIIGAYRDALAEAKQMNTKPMVDTIGQAVDSCLTEMLEIANKVSR